MRKLVGGSASPRPKSVRPTPEEFPAPHAAPELIAARLHRGVYIRPATTEELERPEHARLTAREVQILEHVREGWSNKLIGDQLDISERTVKSHLTFIMVKLAARDRTHAVVLAIRYGIIDV